MRLCHLNRCCFSFCANVSIDRALSRRSAGKLFQFLAPTIAKFRVLSLMFVPVTARQFPDAADSRCRRLATDITGTVGGYMRRRQSTQTLIDHHRQLTHNALTNWKPVEFTQDRSDVLKPPGLCRVVTRAAAVWTI